VCRLQKKPKCYGSDREPRSTLDSAIENGLDQVSITHNSIENTGCNEPFFGEHLLLRELTHRINNELAATIGFVSLSAARSDGDDVKVALAGVMQHINDSARVYRALQMPADRDWIDAAAYLAGPLAAQNCNIRVLNSYSGNALFN
jgi:two-component sensor histidine kinase